MIRDAGGIPSRWRRSASCMAPGTIPPAGSRWGRDSRRLATARSLLIFRFTTQQPDMDSVSACDRGAEQFRRPGDRRGSFAELALGPLVAAARPISLAHISLPPHGIRRVPSGRSGTLPERHPIPRGTGRWHHRLGAGDSNRSDVSEVAAGGRGGASKAPAPNGHATDEYPLQNHPALRSDGGGATLVLVSWFLAFLRRVFR
jgi:hypothetical protein